MAGLTQEQFAATLGVTYTTINRWVNRRSKPSPLAMEKIERMLEEMGGQG
ncbi:MAG: helix-turn-helix transcriptional regulator [Nostoc sp.]